MEGALGTKVALDVGTVLNHLGIDRPAGPMALAGHLLLLLLCTQSVPSTALHKRSCQGHNVGRLGGPREADGQQEGPLGFCSYPGSRRTALTSQGIGEPCEENAECQSDCCATSSLNPQKYCTSQTIFLKCLSWQKPNGYACSDHTQCRSNCCVTNSDSPLRSCTPRTIFLQCLSWRKPNRDYCSEHSECRSQCCLSVTETAPARCLPRTGILARCLPP
ncbi:leucine-rich colipase-like protein 1 [Sturnira hondurensis]|uniref:leucine-rich colipase-like protein 1 n=1 Tax=Sturnira hondurensis TaxID=192404 RepID=UPI001879C194|nr:leucine-rich colipase-like protein 1 [Sturnira hondurensis]